ncbi:MULTISPECIES: hypothetical protein [Herbaspirillum]|uniref:hypothetical protein n=1 Tax=Herbaspirillum TaxID=963 RepID=UPI00034C6A2D|nr:MULTISPECIES: hypothetical protein [Herbaspirillum]NQE50576.1 hypothetical protein [Herbaspirillum rubrisubalbicans]
MEQPELPLLYVRNLMRKGAAFIWIRPDGRQFFCKTMRQLVARIMDYDGYILHTIFQYKNGRLIRT